jgi:zinc protease
MQMKLFRTAILGVLAIAILVSLSGILQAKEEPPPPEKMKKLSFPDFKEFDVENGLEVVVVEHHEQPIVTVSLIIKSGATLDGKEKSSLAQFTSSLLNKGTKDKSSEELAEWIESVGGNYNSGTGNDFTYLNVSILSEYLDTAYEFLADIVMNPTFPDDEFEEERKRVRTELEFQLSDPNSMADRHFNAVVYGHHPYAIQPTVESVDAVTRDDIASFHERNYVANNAVIFVVGDVKHKDVKKDIKEYFGQWRTGTPDVVEYPEPPERTSKNISLYNRVGSVQTNLYVGHLGLRPLDPDWAKVTVANRVLGGGAPGRLFLNLREEKGWTYGAYSNFTKPVDIGYFRATANVRTEVTDSALAEMLHEIERITEEPVTDEELKNAKSYLIGNFPTTIETPNQIANQIGQVKLLGLGKDYLEGYRKEIAKVTVTDVQEAMQNHLRPERLAMVLVGDANEVIDKVEPIASVALYDIDGTPMTRDELAIQPSDYDFDTSILEDHKATYAITMQEMNIGDLDVTLKKTSEETFEASSVVSGMFSMEEHMTFGADNFEPVSYKLSMTMGPQQMSTDLTFENGTAKGKINGPEGPKDVDVDMVGGTLIAGTVEYVIATLPLAVDQTYKFPVLDGQSGTLQSVTIQVLGEEELMVAAGSFSTFKLKVKRADGESVFYCRTEAPHLLVKQEVPAQMLSIELKSREE